MTNGTLLRAKIEGSGISLTFIAKKMECSRNRIYSILAGDECTASEIIKLSEILRLTKKEREDIFLSLNVN